MNDKDKTALLTKIGYLILRQMRCYEVGTEIYLCHRDFNWQTAHYEGKVGDNHSIIDLVGIQREYAPVNWNHPTKPEMHIFKAGSWDILRGIEVKVSKSDLGKGFIQHGCTFHYLMMPTGLAEPNKISRDIGLIEVDLSSFKILEYGLLRAMDGVAITRNPRRKEAEQLTIERCKDQIAQSLTNQAQRWIMSELKVR